MRKISDALKDEIINIRLNKRLSSGDIAIETNVAKTTVARILKEYPLSQDEINEIYKKKSIKRTIIRFDLTGQTFGRLTAIRPDFSPRKKHDIYWLCKCVCGNERFATSHRLRKLQTVSCGCLDKENKSVRSQKNAYDVCLKAIFGAYRKSAISRSLDFRLTIEVFSNLIMLPCFYCGVLPNKEYRLKRKLAHKNYVFLYNGLDRKNNDCGYTIDNCVTCCSQCNYAKLDFTYDEFLNWIKRIKIHTIKE